MIKSSDVSVVREEASKRGLVIVATVKSQEEDNKCDLDFDLVRYRGPVVFEKGEHLSEITIEIKQDHSDEETEFFNMRIGSIHKRVKREHHGSKRRKTDNGKKIEVQVFENSGGPTQKDLKSKQRKLHEASGKNVVRKVYAYIYIYMHLKMF